jgi:hypothetical protein
MLTPRYETLPEEIHRLSMNGDTSGLSHRYSVQRVVEVGLRFNFFFKAPLLG